MKYAVISDIHGNLPALKAVLADAEAQGAEKYLFLGDYCISAPWPNEVVDLVRARGAAVIRGNEENKLELPDGEDAQFAVSRWAGRQLRAENREWLRALPEQTAIRDGSRTIYMAHGSRMFIDDGEEKYFSTAMLPVRYRGKHLAREEFLSDVRKTLESDWRLRRKIKEMLPGVYLFGHTHIQWHARPEGILLVNPGSCGLNLDGTGSGAPYTLLTVEGRKATVEERRVPYDLEDMIERVKGSGQYGAARVWSEIVMEEWRGGYERVTFFLRHVEEYARRIGDERRPFMKDTWEAAYEEWKRDDR